MNPYSLADKTIVVTGASSGIGRAVAEHCAKQGAQVILLGRNTQRLQATLDLLPRLSANPHQCSSLDLTDESAVIAWGKKLTTQVETIHGIVHAAGVTATYPFRLTKSSQMHSIFETNVFGAMLLTKSLLKSMKGSKGSIIFITSVMASVGEKAKTLYSMSKGALLSGARSLALELSGQGIRVNCVSPGVVNTPMTADANYKKDEAKYQAMLERHPLGLGEPEDVAHTCTFLLSDAARWITGSDIKVDGGYTAQ